MLMFLLKVGLILATGFPMGMGFNIAWLFFIGIKKNKNFAYPTKKFIVIFTNYDKINK